MKVKTPNPKTQMERGQPCPPTRLGPRNGAGKAARAPFQVARCFFGIWVLVFGVCFCAAAPRDGEWKKVEEAIQKGLPGSAIEVLEPIIRDALRERAYPEAVKAIARKIVLEGNIQGNKP